MNRPPVSVTIITKNEEHNIAKAINSVRWAEEILVVDSGSSDQTTSIAEALGARVLFHPWQGYGEQKNFAQSQARNDWILNIDADEFVSPALAKEIQDELEKVGLKQIDAVGFDIPRRTYYLGKWIRHGGWFPNYLTRLANRKVATWTEPRVHEAWVIQGKTSRLTHPLDHNSFQSIGDQILTNLRFSRLGSRELLEKGQKPSLLFLLTKPVGKFFETYVIKGGYKDGLLGFIISINAAHSMFLKYAFLFEDEIRKSNKENL